MGGRSCEISSAPELIHIALRIAALGYLCTGLHLDGWRGETRANLKSKMKASSQNTRVEVI
jgi:hypothetical protein